MSRSWHREGRAFRGLCIIPHVPSLAVVVRLVGNVLEMNPDPYWMFGGICHCRITKPVLTDIVRIASVSRR